jgi:hypothetical protein
MPSSLFRTALALLLTLAFLLGLPFDSWARSGGHASGYSSRPSSSGSGGSHRSALSSSRSSIKCEGCPRDSRGKIKRDPSAKSEFKRTHPKPPGCDRCEVDHIVPLSKGGRDDPSNMQWLPKAQHQDKTKRDLRP